MSKKQNREKKPRLEKLVKINILGKWYTFTNIICDPTQANEAFLGEYQNWHFKFNLLFNI